jgi:hypothetical protein
MSGSEDIERVVASLNKVPPKQLLIIELANKAPRKSGEFDYAELAEMQPEIELAIAEAKMYGSYTMMAVDTLKRLTAREEDV